LIDEESVSPGKLFGNAADRVGKVVRLFKDEQFFETERHWVYSEQKKESREWRVDRGERVSVLALLSTFYALLSIPASRNRGDGPSFELLIVAFLSASTAGVFCGLNFASLQAVDQSG
jgi:hypothetical protein